MYRVINQGQVVGTYLYFFDAWLCAVLDFPRIFTRINGPEGIWIINPQSN